MGLALAAWWIYTNDVIRPSDQSDWRADLADARSILDVDDGRAAVLLDSDRIVLVDLDAGEIGSEFELSGEYGELFATPDARLWAEGVLVWHQFLPEVRFYDESGMVWSHTFENAPLGSARGDVSHNRVLSVAALDPVESVVAVSVPTEEDFTRDLRGIDLDSGDLRWEVRTYTQHPPNAFTEFEDDPEGSRPAVRHTGAPRASIVPGVPEGPDVDATILRMSDGEPLGELTGAGLVPTTVGEYAAARNECLLEIYTGNQITLVPELESERDCRYPHQLGREVVVYEAVDEDGMVSAWFVPFDTAVPVRIEMDHHDKLISRDWHPDGWVMWRTEDDPDLLHYATPTDTGVSAIPDEGDGLLGQGSMLSLRDGEAVLHSILTAENTRAPVGTVIDSQDLADGGWLLLTDEDIVRLTPQ